MRLERAELRKGLLTDVANVRSLARMDTLVTDDVALMMEPLTADATHVRTFVGVRSAVNLQVEPLEERLAAMGANVVSLLQMVPLHVLLRIKCRINYFNSATFNG